ncbi:hypothetical protein U1Q18_033743 [Sarracenia purpurea var. burkii]
MNIVVALSHGRRRTVSPPPSPSAVFEARSTSPEPRSNQIAPCRRCPAASPPSLISEFEARSEFDRRPPPRLLFLILLYKSLCVSQSNRNAQSFSKGWKMAESDANRPTIAGGGVIPHIHKSLINKTTKE